MQHSKFTTIQPAQLALLIEVKNVYGVLKAYPACARARCIADIAGTKTITRQALNLAEQLGFRVIASANADWSQVQ